MKAKFFLFLFLVLYAPTAFSQAENNKWYFGYKAALDFNTNTPTALTDNPNYVSIGQGEGTVSNKVTGDLLFYTNGKYVWGKNHQLMVNGTDLNGALCDPTLPGEGQSGLILPSISNRNQYYVFSTGQGGQLTSCAAPSSINYSIVDMTASNNLGDVLTTAKNLNLLNPSDPNFTLQSPAITATVSSSGSAYWILYPIGNSLYAFRLDSNGLSSPVISSLPQNPNHDYYRHIKVSPTNDKIGMIGADGSFKTYIFNSATGMLGASTSYNLNLLNYYFSNFEFSPLGNIAFLCDSGNSTGEAIIMALNLVNGDIRTIVTNNAGNFFYNLQRAKNNEIYFSTLSYIDATVNHYLNKLADPNNFYTNINFNTVYLGPDNDANWTKPQVIPTLSCALYEQLSGTNITNSYSYQVSDHITTLNDGFNGDYVVGDSGSQTINLYAGNYVALKSGTLLKSGSNVLAKIQPCGSVSSKTAGSTFGSGQNPNLSIANDLVIAPNPASNLVLVKTTQNSFNKVTIMTLDGKVVILANNEGVTEYSLDISALANGIYLVTIDTNEGATITKKLVKN
jgi:hypothetical protein